MGEDKVLGPVEMEELTGPTEDDRRRADSEETTHACRALAVFQAQGLQL